MADEIDLQIEREEKEMNILLAVRKVIPRSKGACFNCDEKLPDGQMFCDADCRDDYEKEQFQKSQAPRFPR